MDISVMYGFTIKTETLWKLAETCTSVLRKLKLTETRKIAETACIETLWKMFSTFQHG